MYKNRYPDDIKKQNAYLNAIDCMYYGYGISYWNDCGCDDRLEVWKQAREDLANDF